MGRRPRCVLVACAVTLACCSEGGISALVPPPTLPLAPGPTRGAELLLSHAVATSVSRWQAAVEPETRSSDDTSWVSRSELEASFGYRWPALGLRWGWLVSTPGGAARLGPGGLPRPSDVTGVQSLTLVFGPPDDGGRWGWSLEVRGALIVAALHAESDSCEWDRGAGPLVTRRCHVESSDGPGVAALGTALVRGRWRTSRRLDLLAALGVQSHPVAHGENLEPGPVLGIVAVSLELGLAPWAGAVLELQWPLPTAVATYGPIVLGGLRLANRTPRTGPR